jgi:hypothetical protein
MIPSEPKRVENVYEAIGVKEVALKQISKLLEEA